MTAKDEAKDEELRARVFARQYADIKVKHPEFTQRQINDAAIAATNSWFQVTDMTREQLAAEYWRLTRARARLRGGEPAAAAAMEKRA